MFSKCRFCGSLPRFEECFSYYTGGNRQLAGYKCVCSHCGQFSARRENFELAADLWNKENQSNEQTNE